MRVRALLLNPTKYFVLYKLVDTNGEPKHFTKEMIVDQYDNAIFNSTEFERGNSHISAKLGSSCLSYDYLKYSGVYKIRAYLWDKKPEAGSDGHFDEKTGRMCGETDFIAKDPLGDLEDPDNFIFTTGSIHSFMITGLV